jgi:hypothetical protein
MQEHAMKKSSKLLGALLMSLFCALASAQHPDGYSGSLIVVNKFNYSTYEKGVELFSFLQCRLGEQVSTMAYIEAMHRELFRVNATINCAVGAGNLDEAFENIQLLMDAGHEFFGMREHYDELKADPRWQAVEEYMNFPVPN